MIIMSYIHWGAGVPLAFVLMPLYYARLAVYKVCQLSYISPSFVLPNDTTHEIVDFLSKTLDEWTDAAPTSSDHYFRIHTNRTMWTRRVRLPGAWESR